MTINAFHPDYIKTHMPHLLTRIKKEASQSDNGQVYGAKSRVQRETVEGKFVNSINCFPKTKKAGT